MRLWFSRFALMVQGRREESAIGANTATRIGGARHRGGRIAALLLVVLASALLAVLLLGADGGYRLKAQFDSVSNLGKGNIVQIGGRTVGTVGDVVLTPNGLAEVTMDLDEDVAPLREGTKAHLRVRSLSGSASRFIDLEMPPGTSQRTIPDGGVIPPLRTTSAVEIDHFFSMFDRRTRGGVRNAVRGLGRIYQGRAEDLTRSLLYLNPSLFNAQRLFRELTYDRHALRRFLEANGDLMSNLASRRGDVSRLVDRLSVFLDAVARERDDLATAINRVPPLFRRANTTFVNLRATLDDAEPLIEETRPVAPRLRAVLAELRPFAREARPTVRSLAQLVRRAGSRNDLVELARAVIGFHGVAVEENVVNGRRREGSLPAAARSLRGQTPQWEFQRPYVVDLTGWFDDFSHSGIVDANGNASRVASTTSAFAFANGQLYPVPEELRAQTVNQVAALNQRNRCPGSTERPHADRSNRDKPSPDFNCDDTQRPPGK